ncbi:MAG: hypothetical protein ABSB49_00710 [Polyangia bacterium]|jgi:hypothetical protein
MAESTLQPRSIAGPRRRAAPGLVGTVLVLAGAALALRILDAVPGWLLGIPRGVHVSTSLEEAEARSGLALGSVGRLAGWQITDSRVTVRPVHAVAISLRRAGTHGMDLVLYQGGVGGVPAVLCPPLGSFNSLDVRLAAGLVATLKAELGPGGSVVEELAWWQGSRLTVIRSVGSTVELLGFAKQLVESTHDLDAQAQP